MQNRIVTYEQRVARMKKPGDEDRELLRAKRYMMRIRSSLQNRALSVEAEKAERSRMQKAEAVLRKLRQNIFDLEEMLQQVAD